MVPARVTAVTLGARDQPALRDFYAGLGWPLTIDLDGFAAFANRGVVLLVWGLDELVADAHAGHAVPPGGLRGFTLAINVATRDEVDEVVEDARAGGARIAKEPEDTDFGGRSAYFADPEDNH